MHVCFYRFCLCLLYYCFACLLPLEAHAKPTGEIIFRHPDPTESNGLWIGNVNFFGQTSRRILDHDLLIETLSIQEGDRYIVAIARRLRVFDIAKLGRDLYLLDRKYWAVEAKNLTRGLYGDLLDASISRNGDVVFTTGQDIRLKDGTFPKPGIYFISHREIKKPHPKAELLLQLPSEAGPVDWAHNGKKIVFSTGDGCFLMDVFSGNVSQILKGGRCSSFSPDQKKIAFMSFGIPRTLSLLSLANQQELRHIKLEDGVYPRDITWSADSRYFVYTIGGEGNTPYSNVAVPVSGGRPIRILQKAFNGGVPVFKWTNVLYTVEPTKKLTTLWGELKQTE